MVNNLSEEPQTCELELSGLMGMAVEDLFTGERLADVGEEPYRLDLGRYEWRWLDVKMING